MKKILLVILVILLLIVSFIVYKAVAKKKTRVVLPDKIVDFFGEETLPGAQWGLIRIVCQDGGFNIIDYAGKEARIESSLALGKFYQMSLLNLNKIYVNNKVICEYYTNNTRKLTPGVFAINDPNITGNKK